MNEALVRRLVRAGELYGSMGARGGRRQLEMEAWAGGGTGGEAAEAERRIGGLGKRPLESGPRLGEAHDPYERWKRIAASVRNRYEK